MSSPERTWPQRLAARIPSPLTIAEVMTRTPHTIGREQRLSDAYDLMRKHRVRHLPVMDGDELAGVLSQRDLYFLASLGGVDELVDKVSVAMIVDVYHVAPGDLVSDVAREMSLHKVGCAIVMDRRRVVGIFTATDALALLGEATANSVA